jgi:hypothetical protein
MRALPLSAALLVLGCSSAMSSGGQTGEEGAGCVAVSTVSLAPGEASVLGFGRTEVLANAGGRRTGELRWAKGGTTPLTVTFTPADETASYLDREWRDDSSGDIETAVGFDCRDVVSVKGTLAFHTEDGAFDESFVVTILATTAGSSAASTPLDFDALTGSYAVTEVDPADYDALSGLLDLRFEGGVVGGSLTGMGEVGSKSGGPTGTVSARPFDIATF